MNQWPRALAEKLQVETYSKESLVQFRFRQSGTESPTQDTILLIPLPVVFRMYHLGRAYDLKELIHLHPAGVLAYAYGALQGLVVELEQICGFVDDPVVKHYARSLAEAVAARVDDRHTNLVVRPL